MAATHPHTFTLKPAARRPYVQQFAAQAIACPPPARPIWARSPAGSGVTASSLLMRQNSYDWPHVGGSRGMALIAVVAGMGVLALFDPGSVDVLVAAEL